MKISRRLHACRLLYVLPFLLVAPVFLLSADEAQKIPVQFIDAHGRELCRFEAELAVTPAEQSRGLMYRPYMPRKNGMLFVNDREEIHNFWMKNTYIPLDIIFMDGHNDVVYVHQNARPHDEATINSRYPARYVFEINAGEAKECKIKRGIKARFGKSSPDR